MTPPWLGMNENFSHIPAINFRDSEKKTDGSLQDALDARLEEYWECATRAKIYGQMTSGALVYEKN